VKTARFCRCSIRTCVVNARDEGYLPAGSEVVYEGRYCSDFPALKIKARAILSLPDSLLLHLIDRDRHLVDHRLAYPGTEPDRLVEVCVAKLCHRNCLLLIRYSRVGEDLVVDLGPAGTLRELATNFEPNCRDFCAKAEAATRDIVEVFPL